MTFLDFWHKLVFHPKKFFEEDFDGRSSPFLFITIAVYGISNSMDSMDEQFAKGDQNGEFVYYEWLNSWPIYWFLVLIGGAVSGYLFYLLGGWFYNLRIQWSQGTSDREKARFLFLYPEFVPALIYVLTTAIHMIGSPVPYEANIEMSQGEAIGSILLLVATYYSVYISYIGVTTATDVNVSKARTWFLILPLSLYTLAYGAIIILLISLIGL